MSAGPALRRRVRQAGRIVAALLGVVVLAAAGYEHVSAWRDGLVLTQVGRSVNIGGRSLNIHCAGHGRPTVLLVSGRTAPGYVWTHVQRGVASFARVCWYDRADIGWSDPGPDPAWADTAASDLHRLANAAGLAPPFVMVGHSYGGHVIRVYHHTYPGAVSGMVFADTALEDAGTIAGMPHRERPSLPRAVIRGLSTILGRLGMMRLIAADPGPPPAPWTAEEWDVLARLRWQRNMLLADAKVGPGRASDDLVRGTGGLDDMPLIVLTQGNAHSASAASSAVLGSWIELQGRFAQRSRRGRHVVVPESGHGMPVEAPQAIVAAVRDIVDAVSASK